MTYDLAFYASGAFSGALVGFILALVGGGGSILATPLIVYLVGVRDPHIAIGTSALAVGLNALLGVWGHARRGNVAWRPAAWFATAGVLGALRDGSELDGVFGSSNLNSDLTGGIGGLIGAKGTQIGSGGLGSRGSGLGGGGTAEGLGGLGTKGRGSGSSGYGSGGGSFGQKGEGGIGTIGGDPIILGALDKSLIDAVIKRHMNQIRYCYQRELTKNPNLGGKITVKFVIAKDGSVSKASIKSSTMNNSAVEGCITGRFMRFQFPEPRGGGIVIVSYPFIFSPG